MRFRKKAPGEARYKRRMATDRAAQSALTAETLLREHLWAHYPSEVRRDPDLLTRDANPGENPALYRPLAEAAELFAQNAPRLVGTALSFDEAGVVALSRALDRTRRDAWLAASPAGDPGGMFINVMVHASAWLGEVIVRAHHGRWRLRNPLWESVVERRHGGAVAPLHWLLKSLADDEVGTDSLAGRFHVHVALADASPDEMPVLADARRLPTIQAPTYDLLVKYLHAHLPRVNDLGAGFLTPREFADRRYQTLGFALFHGGRVLLVHGQTAADSDRPGVVELHWLTALGLDHTDALPCDPGVPCFVRALDDARVEVTLSWQTRPHTHRLSFRGHA